MNSASFQAKEAKLRHAKYVLGNFRLLNVNINAKDALEQSVTPVQTIKLMFTRSIFRNQVIDFVKYVKDSLI